MSEFTPITTQEEFDKMIQKRLAQKEREMTESFKEYMSPDDVKELRADCERKIKEAQDAVKVVEDKLKANNQTVSELTKRAETAEHSLLKNKIAYEHKLPSGFADRLIGETEEEMTKDAEALVELAREAAKSNSVPPLYSTNPNISTKSASDQALLGLLSQIKGDFN